MRVSELYEQVAGLGFEKAIEDGDIFYQAANRALFQVNALRPAIGCCVINHRPIQNLLSSGFEPIQIFEETCFEAHDAKAYYFECDGSGICYIEKYIDARGGAWSIIGAIDLSSTGRFVAYSGFIKEGADFVEGKIRLRFAGEYLYSLRFVALYQHIRSGNADDIPAFEPYTKYDISSLVSDFISFDSAPMMIGERIGTIAEDYDVEGQTCILLPRDAAGCYKVVYRRRPSDIVNTGIPESDDAIIDLDEELCALMVLNIGAYVWADDEPEKAEYYLARYNERAQGIINQTKNIKPGKYVTNNW